MKKIVEILLFLENIFNPHDSGHTLQKCKNKT